MDILKCHSAFTLFRVKQVELLYQEEEEYSCGQEIACYCGWRCVLAKSADWMLTAR